LVMRADTTNTTRLTFLSLVLAMAYDWTVMSMKDEYKRRCACEH